MIKILNSCDIFCPDHENNVTLTESPSVLPMQTLDNENNVCSSSILEDTNRSMQRSAVQLRTSTNFSAALPDDGTTMHNAPVTVPPSSDTSASPVAADGIQKDESESLWN